MRPEIYFLRHTPIDVDIEMYKELTRIWGNNIIVISDTSFPINRKQCGYEVPTDIKTIILDQSGNPDYLDTLFSNKSDAIFLFNGLGRAKQYKDQIDRYKLTYGIVAERDNLIGARLYKKIIKNVFPFVQKIRYKQIISNCSFFLAMGRAGIQCYTKYGVPKDKLFNFMYCDSNPHYTPKKLIARDTIRFLYVGRFDFPLKGLDVLLDSIEKVKGNYTLDLVGGYGNNFDAVIKRLNEMDKVRFIGTWDSYEVSERMNEYDVVIVPSKMDGWNLHCNLSIKAGIVAIATDQSGSNELIEYCGNGLVVKANSVYHMQQAIEKLIENPQLIDEMKMKTTEFVELISNEKVAQYVNDILVYSITKESFKRPKCPWEV